MKRQVMVRSKILIKTAIISLFPIIMSVFCTNISVLQVAGSDNQTSAIGGGAKGGDVSMGGMTLQCTTAGACTITQAPKGGEAAFYMIVIFTCRLNLTIKSLPPISTT
jgi:hypothetical protein